MQRRKRNGDGGCRVLDYLDCIKNKTFVGHVIRTFRILAPGLEDCQHKCYMEDNCVSYNLGPVEGMARSCDLNDADHWMWPNHVVPKKGFEYCPIKNPCSSSPCPSNKICMPDFSWDSFSCVDGIWAQWGSWTTCHLPDCPRTRKRNCTSPTAPQNIGANCVGLALASKECRTQTLDTTGCETALGMENRTILDSQITASSFERNYTMYAPQGARLNNQYVRYGTCGAWAPTKAVGEYIQVDLGRVKTVTKIATQGRPTSAQWVTEYSVSYSNDTRDWTNYYGDCVKKFPGNFDQNTVVANKIEIPIIARYIRVIVLKWQHHPLMRMELYGCTPP
ncbi:EGF-like repeat and discoidin I-like domain-containing protein 3 isoform X3 [Actinia tenebrosa]|uniref:EGF-like repeat and discoidin I-like domain-containing protein 3 isoform X3 n=1 Tax=Actinia tenebrosa TaxID=6105 RepID=A0A6P8I9Y9_ACTTE|nr:EGF-like repeat and discoidin I-like domain-containing protein 3 isoform X3 [Actinia tenebrosa]